MTDRQDGKRRITNQELLLLGLIDKARQGDTRAATAVIDMVMKLDHATGDPTTAGERNG
jgi:hypothetical protein